MLPFPFFLAWKYLKPKRSVLSVITVLSIAGVLLGVAILIVVRSVMTGFGDMWVEKILSFKPHVTVVSRQGYLQDEDALCERVQAVQGVTGVSPVVMTRVLMRSQNRTAAPVAVGVDPERIGKVSRIPQNMAMGEFDLQGDSVVLGIDLATSLGVSPGMKVLVYAPKSVASSDEFHLPLELTVKGIFNMGMRDYDAEFAMVSLGTGRDLTGMERGAQILYVMTQDPFRFDEQVWRVQESLGMGYIVRSWREEDRMLFNALTTEKTMMTILLVFITIVAMFCVTSTLFVVSVQKTNEIGLLKALGFGDWSIMGAFVCHGWIQCMLGVAGGVGMALVILANLTNLVHWLAGMGVEVFPKAIYGLGEIPSRTSWGDVLTVAISVLVFCTLASILPALRAARLDPVEALRHE